MGLMIKVRCPYVLGDTSLGFCTTQHVLKVWLQSNIRAKLIEHAYDHVLVGIEMGSGQKPDSFVFRIREEDLVLIRLMFEISPILEDHYFDLRIKNQRIFPYLHEFENLDTLCGLNLYTKGSYFNTMAPDEYEKSLWTKVPPSYGI